MEKRLLVKIAKELNVGTSTIVEHLSKKGFEIDNKPTANVSDEMYKELLKEFQGSIAIKEQADQLMIGVRPAARKETPVPVVVAIPVVKEVKVEEPQPIIVAPIEIPKEEVKQDEVIRASSNANTPQIKVVGKIDLDKKPVKKPVAEPVENKVATKEVPKPEIKKEVELPAVVEAPVAKESEMIRAETPQLKGLKILGKINTDQFQKPKPADKKKPAGAVGDKTTPGANPATGSQNSNAKKKRKRKKIANPVKPGGDANKSGTAQNRTGGTNTGGTGGPHRRPDEVKEISKKEIDDKIKATMARLNIGGKNKRSKMSRDKRGRMREKQELLDQDAVSGKLQVTEFISVSELASVMNVSVAQVITTCMSLGVIVSINQRLDAELIELVSGEFGHEVEFISAEEQVDEEEVIIDDPADLLPRAPIVTVMGHVDHGKTSLLDYIRKTKVAEGEAGGITQHIGAYEVVVSGDRKITFLDTPGHEAFTAMRARGAKATDVAVIIIAADDNIMPQTKEAISHAQAAGVPMIFAINKIDKPGADPNRIKTELAQMNLQVEEWGGKFQSQDISAKTGVGIEELLDKIVLEAEILDLKANPKRMAMGTVIEASLDKGRGYVSKILVQNGTLHVGDAIVAGEYAGKVKAMFNDLGKKVASAGPATPVMVLGLAGAPQAGDAFKVMEDESKAREIANKRAQIVREQSTRASKRISLDEIGRRIALGTFKELNLIVRGDVDGSVEALSDSLIKLSIEKIQINVIQKAVGQIVDSDVLLASASDAIIIGFQVRPSLSARKLAEKEGVQIKLYSIIYDALNEVKMAMEGMLEPTQEEHITSQVQVREVYKISKIGTIAGCFVMEGKITRNNFIRVIRDGIVVFPTKEGANGEILSLKRFKEDMKDVKSGLECGVGIKNFNDLKENDILETYEILSVKQKLS